MVLGLCRALLRDRTEAEDAAQQVFLSAHRSLLNGAEPREPAAWLATIARNECWERVRRRMREPLTTDAADAVGGVDPAYEAIRRADLAALWGAIRTLPRQQRDALLLRELGGLRYEELAVALEVTEPAVESLLFRARTRLRPQLQPLRASVAPVLRWLVGAGAPALATKVAAVGLVTGTVAAAPEVVERHHVPPPAPAQRARVVHRVQKAVPVHEVLQAVRATPPAPVARQVATERHIEVGHERRNLGEGRSGEGRDDGHGGSRGPDGGADGGGPGGSDG
jgi:RNA polymerase sigma-70 factor (ECF subfamily)